MEKIPSLQYLSLRADIEKTQGWSNYIKNFLSTTKLYFGYKLWTDQMNYPIGSFFMFTLDPMDIVLKYAKRNVSKKRMWDLFIKENLGSIEINEHINVRYYVVCEGHLISYINQHEQEFPSYGVRDTGVFYEK